MVVVVVEEETNQSVQPCRCCCCAETHRRVRNAPPLNAIASTAWGWLNHLLFPHTCSLSISAWSSFLVPPGLADAGPWPLIVTGRSEKKLAI